MPHVYFYTPWKQQFFDVFRDNIERGKWHKLGSTCSNNFIGFLTVKQKKIASQAYSQW